MNEARKKEEAQVRKVERALDVFNKMAPSLTAYASAYAGKRVTVRAGKRTETDGKTIFIRPPMALAKPRTHRISVCGTRKKDGTQRCKACAVRETVITMIHHEIAHISHGSFERYQPSEISGHLYSAVQTHLPEYVTRFLGVVRDTDKDGKLTSLAIAGKTHGHLSMVHLACEDHRINTESYVKEPGLYKRMHLLSKNIFENGVEQEDGTFEKWQDRTPDEQIMIAPLFYMEGFPIEDAFDPDVVKAIHSPEAREVLDDIANGESSIANLYSSVVLLAIWRKHGFLTKNSKPEDEMSEEEQKQFEEDMELLRAILKLLFGHSEKLGCTGDETGDDEGSGPGDGDVQEGIINKVITAKEFLDNVPGHMSGINIFQPGEGPCQGNWPDLIPKAGEGVIGQAVAKARIAFGVNARAKTHRDQKSGRVDARNLGKRAWNEGDSRLFKRKTVPDKRDYEVLIGYDCSGSTAFDGRQEMLKFSVCALADTMHRLGVKFSIYGHNSGGTVFNKDGSRERSGSTMDIYTLKRVSDPWNEQTLDVIRKQDHGGSNLDGSTLQFYRKQLDKSRATDKILMYFTDGMMPGFASEDEVPILKAEIMECQRRGYTLLGVGVFTDATKRHGLPTVQVDSEADYPAVIDHLAKRLMG